jgi:RNA polymerase sigma-32 factor
MKAVKRFDPDFGVRLVSFAVHWIKAEMHEFILRNWRIVKVATTKAQRKLFFNLRSQKKRLGWMNAEEVASVAETLGVSPEEVTRMEGRMAAFDAHFDLDHSEDDSAPMTAPAAYLAAEGADPAEQVEAEDWEDATVGALQNALAGLDERSRDIIQSRWLAEDKATLHTLANRYGVSAERIRQLELGALKKLKGAIAA